MSVLSIIQSHCRLHALNVPSSAINSTDTNTLQLLEIINEILSELVTESKFNVITQEATFSTVPSDDQGPMSTLAPNGYFSAIFETFFDRTQHRRLSGPLTEIEWQEMKALPSAGAFFKFRIRQDHLFLDPIPDATSLIAFEYLSSWCVTDSQGNLKEAVTADNDLFVFPENIVRKGMIFRWKQIKGLPYQADETQYYNLLNNYIARDKVKRRIDVSGASTNDLRPGIFVPSNSWMQ